MDPECLDPEEGPAAHGCGNDHRSVRGSIVPRRHPAGKSGVPAGAYTDFELTVPARRHPGRGPGKALHRPNEVFSEGEVFSEEVEARGMAEIALREKPG